MAPLTRSKKRMLEDDSDNSTQRPNKRAKVNTTLHVSQTGSPRRQDDDQESDLVARGPAISVQEAHHIDDDLNAPDEDQVINSMQGETQGPANSDYRAIQRIPQLSYNFLDDELWQQPSSNAFTARLLNLRDDHSHNDGHPHNDITDDEDEQESFTLAELIRMRRSRRASKKSSAPRASGKDATLAFQGGKDNDSISMPAEVDEANRIDEDDEGEQTCNGVDGEMEVALSSEHENEPGKTTVNAISTSEEAL